MRISTPLTSRARKHNAVIQWVTRITVVCRGATVLAGVTEPEVGAQTESAIWESVSVPALVMNAGEGLGACDMKVVVAGSGCRMLSGMLSRSKETGGSFPPLYLKS